MSETAPPQVAIPSKLSVKEFAQALDIKVTDVIAELMKNGVMATINDAIDFETASIVGEELGFSISKLQAEVAKSADSEKAKPTQEKGQPRPPVIAVMGHVDHGKTSLLDAIRKTKVAAGEAGGITQHLSAYQIEYKGRPVTFLDTPGHEAFSLLREHGAHLTDLAIIVVAADEGIKPQTEEAIKFAQKAGVKIVVAINKIDKTGADSNRVKQQLADKGLNPEDWGGDTVMVEVSAKEGTNLDKLLEVVFLVADIEELTARADGPAEGIVIESHMAHGQGPVATVLVERGELKPGDFVVAGSSYGKVRTLKDSNNQPIKQALPSQPAIVSGWKVLPDLGKQFSVQTTEKAVRSSAQSVVDEARASGAAAVKQIGHEQKLAGAMQEQSVTQLPLVVKADVHGSLESLISSLESLGTDEVKVKVVSQGVGAITESDVSIAGSAAAQIVGFHVDMSVSIKQLAQRQGVDVKLYKVIYELLDDVKANLSKLLKPEIVEEVAGTLKVKGIFKITKSAVIAGGEVTSGKVMPDLLVRKVSKDDSPEIGRLKSVQREQDQVKEVKEGDMCGLQISTKEKVNLEIDDKLEFFSRSEKARSL